MADQALRTEWGLRIKARRQELGGMTQYELALATGIQQGTLSKIERGDIAIRDDFRIAIARELKIEVAELFPYPRLMDEVAS